MLFRYLVICLLPLSLLLSGCKDADPAPGSGQPGETGNTTNSKGDNSTAGDSNKKAPDGNSEPPLGDVTDALKGVPPAKVDGSTKTDATKTGIDEVAGESTVQLAVVSPEDFNDVVAKHNGKVVLIDFWASWCIPCRKGFPHTLELAKKHNADGLVVLTMSLDDEEEKDQAMTFLKSANSTVSNFMSTLGGASYDAFNIPGHSLPHYKIFDRKGELRKTFAVDAVANKGIDPADIDQTVEELLAEK